MDKLLNDIKIKLNKNKSLNYIINYILILIVLFPISIYNLDIGNKFIIIPAIIIAISLLCLFFHYRKDTLIKNFTLMILFSIIALVLKSVDMKYFILTFLAMLGITLLFFYLSDIDNEILFEALSDYAFILLALDAISSLLYQNGLTIVNVIMPLRLLGVGNQITPFILFYLSICLIRYILYKDSLLKVIFAFMFSVISLYFSSSATGLIGYITFLFLLAVFYWINTYKNVNLNLKQKALIILGTIFLIHLLVIVFDIQNHFAFLLNKFFNKNITLTNRTLIWKEVFKLIKSSFLFGNGMPYLDSQVFMKYDGNKLGTHNLFLEITVIGGIPALTIFIISIYNTIRKMLYIKNKNIRNVIIAYFISFFAMSITEVYTITIIIMVFIAPTLLLKFNKRYSNV